MRGIKTKKSSKWKILVAFLFLVLVLGVLLNSVRKVYNKKIGAEEALVKMNDRVYELQKREKELNDSLERLKTQEGLAFEMRRKLNVAEVGESVAIIVEEEIPIVPSTIKISNWQKFKNFVVNLFK
ncbi:MAG: hypothetical protein GX627_03155 [Parcubacteria group bacterium]|nr:hypothetical protein [Parcubacteria group bacterium]